MDVWRVSAFAVLACTAVACALQHPSYTGANDAGADRAADVAPSDVQRDVGVDLPIDVPTDGGSLDVIDVGIAEMLDVVSDQTTDRSDDVARDVAIDVVTDRGPMCGASEVLCEGDCVNLTTNSTHCGRCGTACTAPETCIGGTCSCPGGARACSGSCVSLLTNPLHCGRCGNACPPLQSCIEGACSCGGGRSLCGARCVDLRSENAHCGACGVACGEGMCMGSTCVCAGAQTWCAGRCFDTSTDPMNCGSCGVNCGTRTCVGGVCTAITPTCPAGRGDCEDDGAANSCETDLRNSIQHCGACGRPCRTGQTCEGGMCIAARTCNEVRRLYPDAPSGMYTVRPSALDVSVWCDMSTDGGGWTVIYFWNGSTRPATTMLNYTVTEAALPMMAMQALIAYRNTAYEVVENNWARFDMPAAWRTMAPFRSRNVDVMLNVTTPSSVAMRRLRFGYADFSARCSDEWQTERSAGRICIDGSNTPFFAAFSPVSYASVTMDRCSNSDQRWDTTACSPGRRFTIAVR